MGTHHDQIVQALHIGRDHHQSQPSAAILDLQSVKTTRRGGPERGYDAGKQVAGRKRHLLVDSLGLILVAVVHAASTQDYDGARRVLEPLLNRFSRLRLIWADSIYGRLGLPEWVRQLRRRRKLRLEVVSSQPGQKGFTVLPQRWVVERTFAWLGFHRQLSKDYEALSETSEALVYVAMIRLMLARLA